MPMVKVVIFDFDGVISDSEILHFRAFNEVLAQFDFQIQKPDYYERYLGLTDKDCYKTLIKEGHLPITVDRVPDLVAEKKVIYKKLAESDGHIIEGVRPFLDLLNHHGVIKAVCSGALEAEIQFTLAQAGLEQEFVTVVAADHVAVGKPDPEGYNLTLTRLREIDPTLTAGQCIVIEDSHWGLEAARGAGMKTIAVTNSYPAEQLGMADQIVANLDQITARDLGL
ncbi:MAG: HAD family phosphatase [Planctomycetes bacterium]|nr:HAD family phosphatase [Planctomycetota bacterium]